MDSSNPQFCSISLVLDYDFDEFLYAILRMLIIGLINVLMIRFLTKGSIPILATWLSQAAIEEQTTLLNVILKVTILIYHRYHALFILRQFLMTLLGIVRFFVIYHYIRLFQHKCLVYCRQSTSFGFTGHQVCTYLCYIFINVQRN